MDCDSCLEDYDQAERVPKIVPCGHTVCLRCLRQSARRQCPTCCRRRVESPSRPTGNFGSATSTGAGSPLAAASPPAESTFNFASPPTTSASCPPRCPHCARSVWEMDVEVVSMYGPMARQRDKAALLAEAPGVTRVAGLFCDKDPVWSLQLLQRVAPTLERLSVGNPSEAHLRVVHAMPRLRRLAVFGVAAALDAEAPALPPGHDGLHWLGVWDMPLAMTQSLLRVHGGSLEELELLVGTADDDKWPYSCRDLHSLLERGGLRALRRLVLWRCRCSHELAACTEQLAEVRRVLPRVEVLCGKCDHVHLEWV
ncbi:uncharacterized protein LOC113217393 isoform X3 [Frankliniella occidentalis]|uniref:Uncharacterized protein LOC113217393 isoform X3 n=1 Tax=Frankliniella occidentalis TaxID=133901 RepID=A0A9C6X4Q5_FRAOC|nr:uncharacterized protein LOC113217393 isoform X3 [Frankliniella occidentalis]